MHDRLATEATEPSSSNEAVPPMRSGFFARRARTGKVRVGVLLWALGLPIPLVLLFLLFRGCA